MCIPVHLHTSHTSQYQSIINTSVLACQYTSHTSSVIPVYQSYQYTSRCHHHATTVDVSAPSSRVWGIVAPSSRVWGIVAPVSRYYCGSYSSHLPGVELGPKDHLHTSLVKNTRPLGSSSHIPGELVIPVDPAGNSLELCHYPYQESRTTAQSSLESSSHLDVLLRNLLIARISLSSRLQMRDQYCTTRYPSVRNTCKRHDLCCVSFQRTVVEFPF